MLLNSLVIENIRSYTHEEIIFPRGISLFEGDIGSGKSTILMSIEFALFGLGSQKAESLLAKKSESGYVILEFSVDGAKYEIKRTLKRKSGGVSQDPKNSWIKIGDSTEPLSPSELKQRVLQILKFNEPAEPTAESRIFRYAIFTPQEAMKEVLADSRKRLETIRKAFGIEDYSIAQINAKEIVNQIRTYLAVLQQRFGNISELELQITESQKIIVETNSKIEKFQMQKKELEDKENVKSLELKNMQTRNNEKIKLESRKENVEEKIKHEKAQIERIEIEFSELEIELRENNDKLEKLLEIKKPDTTKSVTDLTLEIKKCQEINNELIRYQSERENIAKDISNIKERLGEKVNLDKESMENILRDLELEKKSLHRFSDELNEKLEKVNDQKIQKQTLVESLKKEIAEFSQLGNACPTCKQEITINHHHSLVDTKNKEIEKISLELKTIADTFFESRSKLKEIQSKIESYDIETLQIQKILPGIEEYGAKSSKLTEIEAKILELVKSQRLDYGENPVEYLSELKDKLIQYENVMSQIKQIVLAKKRVENLIHKYQSEVEKISSEIAENEIELIQIITHLETFEDLTDIISRKESELNSVRRENIQASSLLAASEEKLGNEQEKIAQNQKKIIESKMWEQKFNLVSQYQQWLEAFFVPAIAQVEKQVLLSILQNFNETYRRWYSILVEDPTKESRIDENFTPIVNQDGYDQEIGFLSGGEKTSIALAYRLTLNSLMRKETDSMKSNLLILDEPTDGFSKNQLGKIREVLDELKSEQIILVSHEKELETYVDNIFQISKQDGISKIARMI